METSNQNGLVEELERTASRGESVETYELTRTGIATNPSHSDHLISLNEYQSILNFVKYSAAQEFFAKIGPRKKAT